MTKTEIEIVVRSLFGLICGAVFCWSIIHHPPSNLYIAVPLYLAAGWLGWRMDKIIAKFKAWFRSWKEPGKPVETFFDDPKPKGELEKLKEAEAAGKELDSAIEKAETERRLFWLEQEFGRFRSQFDQFHPLKSGLEELRGMVAKLSDEVSTFKASKQGDDAARNHRIDVVERELTIELSKVKSTLEHVLKTRVSEENFAPLKQTVGRHDTEVSLLQAQIKKLEAKVNAGVPFEVARLAETLNELKREHSGTRSIVNSLQGFQFERHTRFENRLTALEQACTNDAKFFDAAKQSADIKSVAGFEAREAVKGLVEAAKSELSDIILKKFTDFATEAQEVFDKRYVQVPPPPKKQVRKTRRKYDPADNEAKSVQAFIDKAKAQNEKVLSKRK